MTYAFGDADLAARRLALLAETFAQSSRAFMAEAARTGLRLAGDLERWRHREEHIAQIEAVLA